MNKIQMLANELAEAVLERSDDNILIELAENIKMFIDKDYKSINEE
jgi:hypothetical protein